MTFVIWGAKNTIETRTGNRMKCRYTQPATWNQLPLGKNKGNQLECDLTLHKHTFSHMLKANEPVQFSQCVNEQIC